MATQRGNNRRCQFRYRGSERDKRQANGRLADADGAGNKDSTFHQNVGTKDHTGNTAEQHGNRNRNTVRYGIHIIREGGVR